MIFPSKSIVSFIVCLQITEQVSLVHTVLQHLLEAVLYSCDILMIGHTIPSVIGFQNLHRHLSLLQQFTDEDRNQILCFQRIARDFFLEELFETFFQHIQEIRSQAPTYSWKPENSHQQPHRLPLLHLQSLRCSWFPQPQSGCPFLIHLADTTSHTAVIGQCVLQHKACHARLATIHQILMDGFEAFLAIVIICIDDNERGLDDLLRCKHSLTGSPRLCTAFRQSSPGISLISWKA